jgi:hypothetical protein
MQLGCTLKEPLTDSKPEESPAGSTAVNILAVSGTAESGTVSGAAELMVEGPPSHYAEPM